MPSLPRFAVATSADNPEPSFAALALLAGLTRQGWKVQHFRSWACPLNARIIGPISGLPGRHLDAWLMPPDVCRAVFTRGARFADLAIVEGVLEPQPLADPHRSCALRALSDRHGFVAPLIPMLDLPVVWVVDCRGWTERHLPYIPPQADAVILDGISDPTRGSELATMVRMLLNKPVLASIVDLPAIRQGLADLPLGMPVPPEWSNQLAVAFLRGAQLSAIRTLAESRPAPCFDCCDDSAFNCHPTPPRRLRVAYAMDEAFGGYFPDTLETLEMLGAELCEFSPLRDEALPDGVELVMIGCGFADEFADELSSNHSLISAIRAHVCNRGRIYSEGGGTAYLARTMILGDRQLPGAGVLPVDAELQSPRSWPEPVERRLSADCWLGAASTPVRGYRSNRWTLRPANATDLCPARSGSLTHEGDIVFHYNAVGSLIHLHLAALPDVVARFIGPSTGASLARPTVR